LYTSPFFAYGREYAGIKLLTPLIIGYKYYISFKASLSDKVSCATDKLGMLFSTKAYSWFKPAPIRNFAHIYSPFVICLSIE
jgi:hypothetical protein